MGRQFVYDVLVTGEQPFAVPLIDGAALEKMPLRPNLTGSEAHLTGEAEWAVRGER
jgi:hypothetical protein